MESYLIGFGSSDYDDMSTPQEGDPLTGSQRRSAKIKVKEGDPLFDSERSTASKAGRDSFLEDLAKAADEGGSSTCPGMAPLVKLTFEEMKRKVEKIENARPRSDDDVESESDDVVVGSESESDDVESDSDDNGYYYWEDGRRGDRAQNTVCQGTVLTGETEGGSVETVPRVVRFGAAYPKDIGEGCERCREYLYSLSPRERPGWRTRVGPGSLSIDDLRFCACGFREVRFLDLLTGGVPLRRLINKSKRSPRVQLLWKVRVEVRRWREGRSAGCVGAAVLMWGWRCAGDDVGLGGGGN